MGASTMIKILILTIFFSYSSPSRLLKFNAPTSYNVQTYGAKPDGKTDSTKAFQSAWGAACATTAPATIYVPSGRYLLGNIIFSGDSCKNTAITLSIDGTLVAPSDYNAIAKSEVWLSFQKVTGLSIKGGTLDAQGSKFWACRNSGKSCPKGAVSLGLYGSNNIYVNGLTSLNSQFFHAIVNGCNNVNMTHINISAPEDSPNTDGIHVGQSTGVTILHSIIGTGDDCVSIGPGSTNVLVQNITCGPGHGVSIGSLGKISDEEGVRNVTVTSSTFTGTQNGVRVKTWAQDSKGFARGLIFQHLIMNNVKNPIIIDQEYCPNDKGCPHESSGVKISDVTFKDIRGTSATEVGVNLDCSKKQPCTEITADQIDITYKNKPASASCVNAVGKSDLSICKT